VQFEITEPIRNSVFAWIRHAALKTEDCLFPSRLRLPPIDPYPTIKSGSFGAGSSTSLSVARARCGDKHS